MPRSSRRLGLSASLTDAPAEAVSRVRIVRSHRLFSDVFLRIREGGGGGASVAARVRASGRGHWWHPLPNLELTPGRNPPVTGGCLRRGAARGACAGVPRRLARSYGGGNGATPIAWMRVLTFKNPQEPRFPHWVASFKVCPCARGLHCSGSGIYPYSSACTRGHGRRGNRESWALCSEMLQAPERVPCSRFLESSTRSLQLPMATDGVTSVVGKQE